MKKRKTLPKDVELQQQASPDNDPEPVASPAQVEVEEGETGDESEP